MPDILKKLSAQTASETEVSPPPVQLHTQSPDSIIPGFSSKIQFNPSASSIMSPLDENLINLKRLDQLKTYFTPQLIHMILESDFEYGLESEVDVFLQEKMAENKLATKSWMSEIFVSQYNDPTILIGILRAISRLPYLDIKPDGEMMATAALSHRNVEVRECGIRAFENWGNLQSLNVLTNLQVTPLWLQDYVDRVVRGLSEELNVPINKKN